MKNLNLRLPESLHEALKRTADDNRRSLNSEILRAIEYYLKNAPEAHYEAAQADQIEHKGRVKKIAGK